ncbi:MAG: hypothetical protein Q7S77_02325 [Candidatus Staskawiczbacteria bacterium]|nr:hypothetical protein [Candidatus Staskawiczbacteria bacterium]
MEKLKPHYLRRKTMNNNFGFFSHFNSSKIKKFFTNPLIWVIIFSLPATFALLVPGYFGASDDLHIAWLYEMNQSISIGQIPPRFIPDLSFGFGYPLFNFLFPLPFYIGEIFHFVGFNFVDSIKAVFFLSIPLSAFFMYLLLKEFTTKTLSFLGAVIYVYTPYRATDLYIRGAIGEIVSFVILPILILAVVKLTVDSKYYFRWVGIGAIAFTSLVLSHNITAYMFLPFLILLAIFRLIFLPLKKIKTLGQLLLTFFLGLLISCYFWIPAIMESGLMKKDTVFNFIDHFPTLRQLITPYWGYGASVAGPYDGMSFFTGIVNLLLFFAGLVLIIIFWKKYKVDQKIIIVWAMISIFMAVFLMNFRSSFLWSNLPLLPYFQFPWRFLIIITVMTPILVIALDQFKQYKYIFILLAILTVSLNYHEFRPQDFLGRDDAYYVNRYIPKPIASAEYLTLQEEYLRLPKGVIRPDKNYPPISISSGNVSMIKNDGLNVLFSSEASSEAEINYYKYNFPGWEAKIDNYPVKIVSGSPFSQITFTVPSGIHEVKISFGETNFKKVLDIISLLTFIIVIYLIILHTKRETMQS